MTGGLDYSIEVKGMSRKYGGYAALDNLDFVIESPTVLSLVGKNGSGKSTLMRIVSGWEKPSEGKVSICGKSPYDNAEILRDIIFIDEKITFDFTLSLEKILDKCEFMDKRFDLQFAHEAARAFGLDLKKRISQLSKGMRSQFHIVIGLAFDRPVTILDEPVSGLDESSRRIFYSQLVKAQCKKPRIFLISTHLLGEFEKYADSLMVLSQGKLAAYDSRETFETLFVRVSGLAEYVDKVTDGLETYDVKNLASVKSVTVPNLIYRQARRFAEENNVDIRRVSVNDACVILGELRV